MLAYPYERYQSTAVETASPIGLVVKLYEGAIRFTQRAIRALEAGDYPQAHADLVRAQTVVAELAGSLDIEQGGDVAANLMALYLYANNRLIQANLRKQTKPALEAIDLFRELLDGWRQIRPGSTDP